MITQVVYVAQCILSNTNTKFRNSGVQPLELFDGVQPSDVLKIALGVWPKKRTKY